MLGQFAESEKNGLDWLEHKELLVVIDKLTKLLILDSTLVILAVILIDFLVVNSV
jgi:hypothetical protein